MCGIGGQLIHDGGIPDPVLLQHMADSMRFRGPDDEGTYRNCHIGLVHRRLSIRDLSAAGHCPMASPDGLLQVVFNGEIYNWRELRRELEASGIAFNSHSDTEVILHGYKTWRQDLFASLRGMFALAIWDSEARELTLARDRVGEKPLFYEVLKDRVTFGSSIEALNTYVAPRVIDPVAIGCYLSHSFIPASHTVWKGVKVLPPAHYLVAKAGEAPRLQRYWDFPRSGPIRQSRRNAEKAIENALEDSVRRCLDADVPVGVFLSGGVDSSLICSLAARCSPGIPAFSLGFAEESHSELPWARVVARHLGVPHHEIQIGVDDVIESLPHLVRQYGQPFGDSSSVPSYRLAQLARRHVTVCLSGDGGDESFGGYWRTQSGVYAARYAACVPVALRRHLVPRIAAHLGGPGQRWSAMNSLSLQAPGQGYTNSQSWFNFLREIGGPALRPALSSDIAATRVGLSCNRPEASLVQKLLYDDFQVQLPDAYLTKVDVASMAASLEVRAPFLDQKVLESAWCLPDSAKLNWGRRKWLLKRIAERHVPREVIHRPKMGFAMPLADWFRGRLGEMLESCLADSVSAREGWIELQPVRQILRSHRSGQDHSTRLWLVLWLELWFRLVYAGHGGQASGLPS